MINYLMLRIKPKLKSDGAKLRKAIIDSDALKVAEEEAHVDCYESKKIGYKNKSEW